MSKPTKQQEEVDVLEIQYNLPPEEQRKLIVLPSNVSTVAIPEMVSLAVSLARSARVPLWGVTFIPTKSGSPKPYINADGVKFCLANDGRGVASISPNIIKFGEKKGDTSIVIVTVTMKNGESYNAIGAVMVDDQWNPANALLKAETKAERRAGYKAIAKRVGMPMYDEDMERNTGDTQTLEGSYRVIHANKKEVTTIPQLLDLVADWSDEEFEKVTGMKLSSVKKDNLAQVVTKIEAYKAEKQNG